MAGQTGKIPSEQQFLGDTTLISRIDSRRSHRVSYLSIVAAGFSVTLRAEGSGDMETHVPRARLRLTAGLRSVTLRPFDRLRASRAQGATD